MPNLVNTVEGYARHERDVFTAIADARAQIGKLQVNTPLTPQTFQAFTEAQGALSNALSRLLVIVENYPDLKANTLFQGLMDEFAGTENRINVERRRFNETIERFNATSRRFPTVMVARLAGFTQKTYFKSEEGADKAPKVTFPSSGNGQDR